LLFYLHKNTASKTSSSLTNNHNHQITIISSSQLIHISLSSGTQYKLIPIIIGVGYPVISFVIQQNNNGKVEQSKLIWDRNSGLSSVILKVE